MAANSRVGLTARGGVTAGVGAIGVVGSVLTGAAVFTVLAVIALTALLLAILLAHRGSTTVLQRLAIPVLVERGRLLEVSLSAERTRGGPAYTVVDRLGDQKVEIDLPASSRGVQTLVRYRVRPLRRGVQALGPLTEIRYDPFSLASRTISHPPATSIVVHPVVHRLTSPPRRVGGPPEVRVTAVHDPLAEVRSLRAYAPGDDVRQIHWPASARTTALMVRDRESTRPLSNTIVLDTAERSATETLFEDALEVAASLVCTWLDRDVPVAVRTSDPAAPGWPTPIRQRADAMTLLARVSRTDESSTRSIGELLNGDSGDRLVLIAGAASTLTSRLVSAPSAARRLVVVRLLDGSAPAPTLPVPYVDVTTAEQFATAWSSGHVPL